MPSQRSGWDEVSDLSGNVREQDLCYLEPGAELHRQASSGPLEGHPGIAQRSAIIASSHPANIPIVSPKTDVNTQIKMGTVTDQRRTMDFRTAGPRAALSISNHRGTARRSTT
jgi:hypothetical protein